MPELTSLYGEAFANCTKLRIVNAPKLELGSSDNYNNPDYTTSSYYFESYVRMFAGCTALESVSMNINLRCAYGMFEGCTSLKTVYCPLMEIVGKRLSTAVRLLRRLTSVQSKRYTQTASGAARAFSPLRLRISATSSATPSRDGPRNRVSLFPLSNGALFRRHSKRIGWKPVKRLPLGQAKTTIKLSL